MNIIGLNALVESASVPTIGLATPLLLREQLLS